MSAEDLSWIFDRGEIEALASELSKYFEVCIIAYVRRQDLLAVSHFQEGSKHFERPAARYYGFSNGALPGRS